VCKTCLTGYTLDNKNTVCLNKTSPQHNPPHNPQHNNIKPVPRRLQVAPMPMSFNSSDLRNQITQQINDQMDLSFNTPNPSRVPIEPFPNAPTTFSTNFSAPSPPSWMAPAPQIYIPSDNFVPVTPNINENTVVPPPPSFT
jgi:hypothetical protein